jgi:7-carboxy-7-deazaguanine synthase
MPGVLRVNEIFHSIQGESTAAGLPCVFVRLTGCHLRCSWCDTTYAFHEGRPMSVDEVLDEVARYPCRTVELTGGEPLLQPEAIPLMARLLAHGYRVLLETGGAAPIDAVPEGVTVVLDVKCPGSGESARNLWENLDRLRPGDEIKFVVRDREDYVWAVRTIAERGLHSRAKLLMSPVFGELEAALLAEWILEDGAPVRLQLQLHKILWPGVERGV